MKSSIHISDDGNRIHAKGAAAQALFEAMTGTTRQKPVARFWLQPTKSFPDGAPDRAEYETDTAHMNACKTYGSEWRVEYFCEDKGCNNYDCPQHFPLTP